MLGGPDEPDKPEDAESKHACCDEVAWAESGGDFRAGSRRLLVERCLHEDEMQIDATVSSLT